MKLINPTTLEMLVNKQSQYIALGTTSKEIAYKMMLTAGFKFPKNGKIKAGKAEYIVVDTHSGEIAFKRVK